VEVTKDMKLIRQKMREFKPIRVFLAENYLTPVDVKLILRGESSEINRMDNFDVNILYVDGLVPQKIARESVYQLLSL
jgi:hypothetical protein